MLGKSFERFETRVIGQICVYSRKLRYITNKNGMVIYSKTREDNDEESSCEEFNARSLAHRLDRTLVTVD